MALSQPSSLQRRQLLATALLCAGGAASAQIELTDLARIRDRGVLKVAVYKDYAPFSDGTANAMEGLDVSIAQALAQQLGLKLALLPFDSGENMGDDLRNMVWRGHYLGYGPADVMLSVPVDRYLMQQNRQVLIFAPYMRQVPVLLHDTRALPQVNNSDDLKGQPLAVERGAGAASALLGHESGALRDQIKLYNTGVLAAKAVLEGKAAGAYVMRSQAEAALVGLPAEGRHWAMSPLALPAMQGNGWPVGMAIKADFKQLGQAIDTAMAQLRERGELQAIFKRHGLTLTAP